MYNSLCCSYIISIIYIFNNKLTKLELRFLLVKGWPDRHFSIFYFPIDLIKKLLYVIK
jgi:hypothetical protein